MKKILSAVLAMLMIAMTFSICSSAVGTTVESSVEYFDDGSYAVTTITVEENIGPASARAAKTVTGKKHKNYYSADNELLWTVTVHGTFGYTGTSVTCTKSSTSSVVYDNDWKVTSAVASKSGNKATGTFTVKRYLLGIPTTTKETSVTLTCNAKGVLS